MKVLRFFLLLSAVSVLFSCSPSSERNVHDASALETQAFQMANVSIFSFDEYGSLFNTRPSHVYRLEGVQPRSASLYVDGLLLQFESGLAGPEELRPQSSQSLFVYDFSTPLYAQTGDLLYNASGKMLNLIKASTSEHLAAYDSSAAIVCPPLVFEDMVLIIDSQGRMRALDPLSLELLHEDTLLYRPGPLAWYLQDGRLILLHADGSLGVYEKQSETPLASSELEQWLRPQEPVLSAIQRSLEDVAGTVFPSRIEQFELYAAWPEAVPGSATLFKMDRSEKNSSYLLRLLSEYRAEQPHTLILVFDASGALLANNLGYLVEDELHCNIDAHSDWYCVISLSTAAKRSVRFALTER